MHEGCKIMRLKKEEKARRILSAAIKVFAEDGYREAKISRIAQEAGVAHGSVYTYFKNKEDLLFKMIATIWQELGERLDTIREDKELDPLQKVHAMVATTFDVFTANPKLGMVVIKEHNTLRKKGMDASRAEYDHLVLTFSKTFEQGVEEGFFDPTIDAPTFLAFVFGGLYHLIHRWADNPKLIDIDFIRQQSAYYIQQALIKM